MAGVSLLPFFMIFYYCMDIIKFDGIWWDAHVCQWLTPSALLLSSFFIFTVEFLSGQIPPYQILFGGWNPFRNPACLPPSCRRNNTYFIFVFYFLPLQKGEEGVKWKGQNCRSWNSVCPLSSPFFKSKRCVFSLWLAVTFPLLSNSAPHLDLGRRPCKMKDPGMIKLRWPYTLL